MKVRLLALLVVVTISGASYAYSTGSHLTTQFVTITAIQIRSAPTTVTSVKNMTMMQSVTTYLVLTSTLPCFTWDNCSFSLSEPFSLAQAPGETAPMPTLYYLYSNGAVSYLNPGLRAFYGGNMLLWIKSPDSSYSGTLTITVS